MSSSTSASSLEHAGAEGPANRFPNRALIGWLALVSALIALAYVANAASPGSPDANVLYRYSTAFGALVQYGLISAVVVFSSRGLPHQALGFIRPSSWPRAGALTLVSLLTIWAVGAGLNVFLKAGEEQGLVPDGWDASRAGPFLANFVVIAIIAPIVEETTYRGLGFAAVSEKLGPFAAIGVTAIAFGLSHGLIVALPILTIFGAVLAWLRWQTRSLYPPIILHALFNGAALIAAVTFGGGL